MRRNYIAILPIAAIILIFVLALIKPLPSVKGSRDQHYQTTEIETSTNVSAEQFWHEQAIIANEMLLDQIESIHTETSEEETTPEQTTEEDPKFIAYDFISLGSEVQEGIKDACDRYEISYDLVIAICIQESSLNPLCVGDNGKAFGLGQIREEFWGSTAEAMGLYDWRTDPVQNATMVCYLMHRQMIEYHHSMKEALNIYRHGVMDDMTEPDGITYYDHILSSLNWLEQMKEEKNGRF